MLQGNVTATEVRAIFEKATSLALSLVQGGLAIDDRVELEGSWRRTTSWRKEIDAWSSDRACRNESNCHKWLKRGVRSGLDNFVALGLRLTGKSNSTRLDLNLTDFASNEKKIAIRSLFDDEVREFRDFEQLHLGPALTTAMYLRLEAAGKTRDRVNASIAISLPIVFVVIALEIALYHRKLMKTIGKNLTRTQSMVLMVPTEWLMKSVALKELLGRHKHRH
ncbi:MAG: hypothetical protein MHM6MM_007732 [Cercozoa sp. M6MM]